MEDLWSTHALGALRLLLLAACGVACVMAYRWTRRVWAPLGLIVGVGIAIRAWFGLALFAISYYDLPIVQALHFGDGFWRLAPDARSYYGLASTLAAGAPMPLGAPSPSFVGLLALWLRAAGTSPASPMLLNLMLHVGTCVLVVAAFRPLTAAVSRRGAIVTLSALNFSPLLLLAGTQSLKDVFFTFLIVCATVTLFWLVSSMDGRPRRWSWALPMALLVVTVLLMAGVRAYYALFVWAVALLSLGLRLLTLPRGPAVRGIPKALFAAVLLWGAFVAGAGEYYASYGSLLARMLLVPIGVEAGSSDDEALGPDGSARAMTAGEEGAFEAATARVEDARAGFVRSGGATNVAVSWSGGASPGGGTALVLGIATVFVPISLLSLLSLVDIEGGHGFLFLTDIDTLFTTFAMAGAVWVVATSRRTGRSTLPFLAFGVALSLMCAVLLGYVVTNYGTLFRLRLLASVPAWLLPLALTYWTPAADSHPGVNRFEPAHTPHLDQEQSGGA